MKIELKWHPVLGFEGLYEVSNYGGVRSLTCPSRAGRVERKKPKELKIYNPPSGRHPIITLWDADGQWHIKGVHILVAEAFIGPRPHGLVCCHQDDNAQNNVVTNLRWDTQSENMGTDRVRNGTDLRGLKHPKAKLSNEQAAEIKRRLDLGEKGTAIAAEYGVHQSLISLINTNKFRTYRESV